MTKLEEPQQWLLNRTRVPGAESPTVGDAVWVSRVLGLSTSACVSEPALGVLIDHNL